jgi:streptogramin lyase
MFFARWFRTYMRHGRSKMMAPGGRAVLWLGAMLSVAAFGRIACADQPLPSAEFRYDFNGPRAPFAIAIDKSRHVWVTDFFNNAVWELDHSGNAINAAFLPAPAGVAIDASGHVWVAARDFVAELDSSDKVIAVFDNLDTPSADFACPQSVRIDSSGHVWVLNQCGNSVTELIPATGTALNFNNSNKPSPNFNFPQAMSIDEAGNLWVANLAGNSVTELDSSGRAIGFFDNTNTRGANFDMPNNIAFDQRGNAWIVNAGTYADLGSLTELNASGGLIKNFNNRNSPGASFDSPQVAAIDNAGRIWVSNLGGSVTELDSNGKAIANLGQPGVGFSQPVGIAIAKDGTIWVANAAFNSPGNGFLTLIAGVAVGPEYFPYGGLWSSQGPQWPGGF